MIQLFVYTEKITSRVEFILSTLLQAGGVAGFKITADQQSYINYSGPKINYSKISVDQNEVHILPVELLFETGIKAQRVEVFRWKELPAFYKSEGKDIPFDLFAASFYLLSRYEEYLPHKLDMYGGYAHENSLAYEHKFLLLPLVNLWLKEFAQLLQQRFPALSLQPATFIFVPTYDIDIAWSYLGKGLLRNAGGLFRSIARGHWAAARERANVLLQEQKDPFDSYDWLDSLHARLNLKPTYFFLMASKNKDYDKNILPSNPRFRQLVKRIADKYSVGIHPSWQSGDDKQLVIQERDVLRQITTLPITKSRQHYIRMKLPGTYRILINAGIVEDYSMGYGSVNGFRASYCLPYKWYDLENEATTPLVIYPFCYMETNSFYEQKLSVEEARQELEHYYNVTKDVNGLLSTIWHNHFLGTDKMFAGWREMYEGFLTKYF